MTEIASRTRSYIVVSDPLDLEGDGSTDLTHGLGRLLDQIGLVVTDKVDNTVFDCTLTQPDVNTIRVVEAGSTQLEVIIFGIIVNAGPDLPTIASGWTIFEFGSLTHGYVYISDEASLTGGGVADNFVHNCNRRPVVAIPIISDSLGGDYAVTTEIESGDDGLTRVQVTNAPAGTPGCRVLAFFGDSEVTPPVAVGAPATGILVDMASRTLGFLDIIGDPAVPSVVSAGGDFDFDHDRGRALIGSIFLPLLGDDFDIAEVAEVANVLNAVTVSNGGAEDAQGLCLIIT